MKRLDRYERKLIMKMESKVMDVLYKYDSSYKISYLKYDKEFKYKAENLTEDVPAQIVLTVATPGNAGEENRKTFLFTNPRTVDQEFIRNPTDEGLEILHGIEIDSLINSECNDGDEIAVPTKPLIQQVIVRNYKSKIRFFVADLVKEISILE